MYIESWDKYECPRCKAINWICVGDTRDMTSCDPEGFNCWQCHREFFLDDECTETNSEYNRFTKGLKEPN